ncbi:MAG TPA: phage Gp37/Gp68 family protein [Polyangiaceae bacterium]|nr:phage Gp37/Gp68 family protein [Polyangiaceae bacterium]
MNGLGEWKGRDEMSRIEWCDETWNPTRGCSRVSAGCEHCYAERVAHRFSGPGQPYEGLTVVSSCARGVKPPRWTGEVRLVPEVLDRPLRWRKPRRVFVDSMSDLFHDAVPFEFAAAVFGVMAASPRHTFQVLTKRPERMREFFTWMDVQASEQRGITKAPCTHETAFRYAFDALPLRDSRKRLLLGEQWEAMRVIQASDDYGTLWPLPNVGLGVSVENQATADARIPELLDCPAAWRFVSYEPALGPVDFRRVDARYTIGGGLESVEDAMIGEFWSEGWHQGERIDWLIIGGESGPGARPFDIAWARDTIAACKAAGVPVFVKQLGAQPVDCLSGPYPEPIDDSTIVHLRHPKGADMAEWPADLRVRKMPDA